MNQFEFDIFASCLLLGFFICIVGYAILNSKIDKTKKVIDKEKEIKLNNRINAIIILISKIIVFIPLLLFSLFVDLVYCATFGLAKGMRMPCTIVLIATFFK